MCLLSILILLLHPTLSVDVSLSDFSYYRNITFHSPGVNGTYNGTIEHEFQFFLDTASLIAANHLTSDCSDLRIFDPSTASLVDHWFESGCNTAKSGIWLRASGFDSPFRTFELYYGHPLASSASLPWLNPGTFGLSRQPCTGVGGWLPVPSTYHPFQSFPDSGFLLRSYDSTSLYVGGSATHLHNLDGETDAPVAYPDELVYVSAGPYNGPGKPRVADPSHFHMGFNSHSDVAGSLPFRFSVSLCYVPHRPTTLADSMIILFDETVSMSTLTEFGWSELVEGSLSEWDSGKPYVHVVTPQSGDTSGVLNGIEGGTHTHATHSNASIAPDLRTEAYHEVVLGDNVTVVTARHDHRFTNLQSPSGNLSIIHHYLGAATARLGLSPLFPGSISFFFASLPPMGYDLYVPTTLNNPYWRLARIDSELIGTGGGMSNHGHGTYPFIVTRSDFTEASAIDPASDSDLLISCSNETKDLFAITGVHNHSYFEASLDASNSFPAYLMLRAGRRRGVADGLMLESIGSEMVAFAECFGIRSTEDAVCSYGKGICSDYDTCDCLTGFHGVQCDEEVGLSASYVSSTMVKIGYRASILTIDSWINFESSPIRADDGAEIYPFDCSLCLSQDNNNNAITQCALSMEGLVTSSLYLTTSTTIDSIEVFPASDSTKVLAVTIEAYVPPSTTDVGLSRSTLELIYGVAGGVGFLFFVLLICAVGVLIFSILWCRKYQAHKKRISRIQDLDDFDVLLQEHEAWKRGDRARVSIQSDLMAIDFADVTLDKEVGRGGSDCVVYLATWRNNPVAFKMFRAPLISSQDEGNEIFDEFEKEVSILASLRHPNVLQFFGAAVKLPRVGMVMEFCPNGDIKQYLSIAAEEQREVTQETRRRFLLEIASAMAYLHSVEVIHRDLKNQNVLLSEELSCKIMDFGMSRVTRKATQNASMTKAIGTSLYMAPEMTLGEEYGKPVDVFSFGIMIYEILSSNFEPYGKGAEFVEMRVASNPHFRPPIARVQDCPSWLRTLTSSCWQRDPSQRPTFDRIISSLKAAGSAEKVRVVYIRRRDQTDLEAIDVILVAMTLSELSDVVRGAMGIGDNVEEFQMWGELEETDEETFFGTGDLAGFALLRSNSEAERLCADAMVIIDL